MYRWMYLVLDMFMYLLLNLYMNMGFTSYFIFLFEYMMFRMFHFFTFTSFYVIGNSEELILFTITTSTTSLYIKIQKFLKNKNKYTIFNLRLLYIVILSKSMIFTCNYSTLTLFYVKYFYICSTRWFCCSRPLSAL